MEQTGQPPSELTLEEMTAGHLESTQFRLRVMADILACMDRPDLVGVLGVLDNHIDGVRKKLLRKPIEVEVS